MDMKTRFFNLIILDESGSMSAIETQAINGVNETVQTIRAAQKKHEDQEHFVSLVSFNSDSVKMIYDKVEADGVEELTNQQYCPSCCTPLYDAMGSSLTALQRYVAEGDMVLVTIITDGYENASKEYNLAAIKKLVESLKTKGWMFTYIGANQDAEAVAKSFAIDNSMEFTADCEETSEMFRKECKARSRYYSRASACMSKEDIDNLREMDYYEE